MLYQKQRAEIGFDVWKVVISTSATKTVEELQAFLDEDSTQTLKQ